jgi:hypothetical protein
VYTTVSPTTNPQYFPVLSNDIDAFANNLKDIKLVDPTNPDAFVNSITLTSGAATVGTVTVVVSLGSDPALQKKRGYRVCSSGYAAKDTS